MKKWNFIERLRSLWYYLITQPCEEQWKWKGCEKMADNNAGSSGNGQQQQADVMKRTIKDSVFTNLFQDKKYLLQLYKALHPEDTDITEDKLTDITIKNVLTDNIPESVKLPSN